MADTDEAQGEESTKRDRDLPRVTETIDGFFTYEGAGPDVKYATKEEAKRVARNVSVAERARSSSARR